MSEEIRKLLQQEIPQIPMSADGMIVRLTKEHRKAIIGIDGAKYFVPSVAMREGTKIIFLVAQEEAMPNREECLRIKEQGMLFGLPVNEEEISLLDKGEIDYISFNIVNTNRTDEITFMVEVRRKEDLGN